MFKVVPDQLRISDGWVRCGQCDEVFDANSHLQSDLEVVAAPARGGTPPSPLTSPSSTGEPWDAGVSVEAPTFGATTADYDRKSDTGNYFAHKPHELDFPPEASVLDLSELSPAWDLPSPDSALVASTPDDMEVAPDIEEPEAKAVDVNQSATPSFMQADRMKAVRRSPFARAALWTVCLLSGVALVFQAVVQERDRIAATEPATAPVLMALCELAGCELAPLQQIESVVIDSSSFVKLRADVYRLNFTLRNSSTLGVAVPSLELSLTDMQDQPVVRRVIAARELSAKSGALSGNSELTASLAISVKLPEKANRIAGYRLLVFYP
jgi:predicted Zn finger-like uncharacterized protein